MSSTSGVKIIGVDDLLRKFAALGKVASGPQLGKAALAGALMVETQAKLSMGEDKTGTMYGNHQASAPGEAPAIDTGLLVNSVKSELQETTATSAWAAAGVEGAEYGEALEFGTGRIAPRPFMRPAVDDHHSEIEKAVRVTLERQVLGAANG